MNGLRTVTTLAEEDVRAKYDRPSRVVVGRFVKLASCYGVIAIHDIGASSLSTWSEQPPSLESSWLVSWFETSHPGSQISFYDYRSSEDRSSILVSWFLHQEATRLLEAISQLKRRSNARIIFVSHGFGGNLVKEVMPC